MPRQMCGPRKWGSAADDLVFAKKVSRVGRNENCCAPGFRQACGGSVTAPGLRRASHARYPANSGAQSPVRPVAGEALDLEPVGPKAHGRTLQPVPYRELVQPGLDLPAILFGPQLARGDERPLEGPPTTVPVAVSLITTSDRRKEGDGRTAAGSSPPSKRRPTRAGPCRRWDGPSRSDCFSCQTTACNVRPASCARRRPTSRRTPVRPR